MNSDSQFLFVDNCTKNLTPLFVQQCEYTGTLSNGLKFNELQSIGKLDLSLFPTLPEFNMTFEIESTGYLRVAYTYEGNNFGILSLSPTRLSDRYIPMGERSKGQYYSDMDQGYSVIVFDEGDFLYQLFGDDSDQFNRFDLWYRINKLDYLEKWKNYYAA